MDIGMRAMSSDMGGILTYPGRGMKVLTTRRSLGLRRRPLLGDAKTELFDVKGASGHANDALGRRPTLGALIGWYEACSRNGDRGARELTDISSAWLGSPSPGRSPTR